MDGNQRFLGAEIAVGIGDKSGDLTPGLRFA